MIVLAQPKALFAQNLPKIQTYVSYLGHLKINNYSVI